MSRVFGHGDLRLYLLKLLEDGPKHGYELIRLLEDRFLGMYSPSPGTVYPRLAALEEDGLVTSEEQDGRKVYKLTDAGRAELRSRSDEVREVGDRVASSARDVAKQIRDEVRASVRDLRRDMRDSGERVREQRREERERERHERRDRVRGSRAEPSDIKDEVKRAAREAREEVKRAVRGFGSDMGRDMRVVMRDVRREERRVGRGVGDLRGAMRSLSFDLEAFVSDVIAAATRQAFNRDRLQDVQDALLDAREIIIEALTGRRPRRPDDEPRTRRYDEPRRPEASPSPEEP